MNSSASSLRSCWKASASARSNSWLPLTFADADRRALSRRLDEQRQAEFVLQRREGGRHRPRSSPSARPARLPPSATAWRCPCRARRQNRGCRNRPAARAPPRPALAPRRPRHAGRAAPGTIYRYQAGRAARPCWDRQHPSMSSGHQAKLRAVRRCRQHAVLEPAQQPLSFAGDEDGNGVVFRRIQRGHDVGCRKQRNLMFGGAPAEEHADTKSFRGHGQLHQGSGLELACDTRDAP